MENLYVVILAGGEGTRFQPLSTHQKPKQFLHITDSKKTMIQQTEERISWLIDKNHLFVSTNSQYVNLVKNQLPQISPQNIIGEPLKKNTAPAIVWMTHLIQSINPNAVILFLPSDHYIHDNQKFKEVLLKAYHIVSKHNVLMTFGIQPTFNSSDYGYIQKSDKKIEDDVLFVQSFKEKPDSKTAEDFIKSGAYFWNAGIFMWQAQKFMKTLEKTSPEIFNLITLIQANFLDFFKNCPEISIDYAMIEKAENVAVIGFNGGWSDVGTWKSLKELVKKYHLKLPDDVKKYLN